MAAEKGTDINDWLDDDEIVPLATRGVNIEDLIDYISRQSLILQRMLAKLKGTVDPDTGLSGAGPRGLEGNVYAKTWYPTLKYWDNDAGQAVEFIEHVGYGSWYIVDDGDNIFLVLTASIAANAAPHTLETAGVIHGVLVGSYVFVELPCAADLSTTHHFTGDLHAMFLTIANSDGSAITNLHNLLCGVAGTDDVENRRLRMFYSWDGNARGILPSFFVENSSLSFHILIPINEEALVELVPALEGEVVEPPPDTDAEFSNVILLLGFDEAHGSTTSTDESSKGLTASLIGGPTCNSTVRQFGENTAGDFGNESRYCDTPTDTDFELGTDDFTIEFWMYPNDIGSGNRIIFDTRPTGTQGNYPMIFQSGSGNLNYFVSSSIRIGAGAGALTALTWQHVAVCRSAGVTKLFINGVQKGSNWADTTNYGVGANVRLGKASHSDSGAYKGYLNEVRITKGIARYTADFTPPTAKFPRS